MPFARHRGSTRRGTVQNQSKWQNGQRSSQRSSFKQNSQGYARRHKAQSLVEMPRIRAACHRSVKLHHAEAVRFGLRKAVRHQLFTDVQSTAGSVHSAAHVGDAGGRCCLVKNVYTPARARLRSLLPRRYRSARQRTPRRRLCPALFPAGRTRSFPPRDS